MLGVPCLTMRPNTERPVTVTEGTNRLIESTRWPLVTAFGEVMDAAQERRLPRRQPRRLGRPGRRAGDRRTFGGT